jgi:recombination protein RecA
VKVVKNKVSAPFRIAEFDVMADGISREGGIVDVGVEMEVIQKSGAFYRFGDLMLGQGKEATKIFLKEKPDISKKVVDEIMRRNKAGETPVEVGVEEK